MSRIASVDIMRAVERALNQAFPGEPVYWDRLPKNFVRPCSTVECLRVDSTDVSIGLVQRETDILVTSWAAADAYGDSSRETLTRRQDTVMDLFSCGKFPVADRRLTVKAAKGDQTPELVMVTGLFSWMDERPGYIDSEVPYDPNNPDAPEGAKIPRMEDFEINEEEIK